MHINSMSEVDGTFSKEKLTNLACRKCNKIGHVFLKEWESSCGGYDDEKYMCKACGHHWWVEGPDA